MGDEGSSSQAKDHTKPRGKVWSKYVWELESQSIPLETESSEIIHAQL